MKCSVGEGSMFYGIGMGKEVHLLMLPLKVLKLQVCRNVEQIIC